jgi:hypothetical protein
MRGALLALVLLPLMGAGRSGGSSGEAEDAAVHRAKLMLQADSEAVRRTGFGILLNYKSGVLSAEQTVLDAHRTNMARWAELIEVYFYALPPQDVSEQMLREMIAFAEVLKRRPGKSRVARLAEFGPRAAPAVPLLEWIRDNNRDAVTAACAAKALKRIRGATGSE